MAEIYITSQKLAQTLSISSDELIEIEEIFDSIPDDKWELVNGVDYRVVQANGLREYTRSGASAIACYLETVKKQSFLQKINELIRRTKKKIRHAFAGDHITDNCSSLMRRDNQFFVSRSDVIKIFKTNSNYLTKMLDVAQREDQPLIKGQDYIDLIDQGGYHFSLSGISKLAAVMKKSQTNTNRQEWCWDIGEVIAAKVDDIVQQIRDREQRIPKVMKAVKEKRDKKTCQVSGIKWNKVNQLKLAVHHLYSKQEYPHLADVEGNLITISCDIHDQFHVSFMGGADKVCTIDDFIRFVHEYHPASSMVKVWLANQKLVLGDPVAQKAKNAHVLYLPASRVS
jgi:5-methylcytosine-specific restriction endonuclease McrA